MMSQSMHRFRSANRKRGSGNAAGYVRVQTPTVLELATLQGQAINYTPTLLVGNGGGTWTADNLPTGASINSSTGQITGTLSTLGGWQCMLIYTEGSYSDMVPVSFHVYDQIDTTTFPGGTYSTCVAPTADNRLYRVQGDIDGDNTPINMGGASGSILDLNGFTVTYDNESVSENTISNGDFSNGTTGWDITNVTGYTSTDSDTLESERVQNDGDNALHSTVAAGATEYIETTGNVTLTSGDSYSITWWQTNTGEGAFFSTMRCVVGSHDSDSIGEISPGGGYRPGSKGYFYFTATTSESAPVRIYWTNSAGVSKEFNLGDITIQRAEVVGIPVTSNIPAPYRTGTGNASNVSITNGAIVQVGTSIRSCATAGDIGTTYDGLDITVRNSVCLSNSGCIEIMSRGQIFNRCTFRNKSVSSSSRDNGYGNIVRAFTTTTNSGIGVHYRDNTILEGPLGGFTSNSTSLHDYPSQVKYNTVAFQSRFTNGFGLIVGGYADGTAVCEGNVVDVTQGADDNGRGIRIGSNMVMRNCTISTRTKSLNQEYQGLQINGSYGIQSENTDDENVIIEDTHVLLTNDADGGAGGCFRYNGSVLEPIVLRNCTLEVDLNFAPAGGTNSDASCLLIGDNIDLTDLSCTNLTLKSNHYLVSCESNTTGELLLVNPHIHIVNSAWYTTPVLFSGGDSTIKFQNPTYEDAFSQTELETLAAAESRVTIETT